jgi:hypothetical protein
MTDSEVPSFTDIITLVAQLVPDIPKPSEIIFEIEYRNRVLWLEGWCDGCIAGKGFPLKGEGMLQEKLDHIRNLTPGFLEKRAMERGMTVQYSGFVPLDDKEFLYGMSWAIFRKQT